MTTWGKVLPCDASALNKKVTVKNWKKGDIITAVCPPGCRLVLLYKVCYPPWNNTLKYIMTLLVLWVKISSAHVIHLSSGPPRAIKSIFNHVLLKGNVFECISVLPGIGVVEWDVWGSILTVKYPGWPLLVIDNLMAYITCT